jgi:hypothetical protein
MTKYYPPTFQAPNFHCARCQVYAHQEWRLLQVQGTSEYAEVKVSRCAACKEDSFWDINRETLILPVLSVAPAPHVDLPEECVADYEEARTVVAHSPKSAAALLRLCIQRLLKELGTPGNNINDDIGSLVRQGLPIQVQKALDVCRVVGNNAVHPGTISLNDDPALTYKLFELINFIVQVQITQPKEIEELYGSLPQGARDGIDRRDADS